MTSTLSSQQTSLAEVARNFVPVSRPGVLLEEHHEAILILRARGATYAFIRTSLSEIGIDVSYSAVVRFCDKYHTELKRIKHSPTYLPSPVAAVVTKVPGVNPSAAASASKSFRDLRGPV